MRELGGSALFGARFRENAARALLLPRRRPGQRTPLWQQRLKAQSLLRWRSATARSRSCSRPTASACTTCFDLPALRRAAARHRAARVGAGRGRRRRTARRSPRRCCSTTSRSTSTRATRRRPSAGRRRCRSTASCCASCSAPTSCASCSTPTRWPRSRRCAAPARARAPTALHDCCAALGDLDAERDRRRRGRRPSWCATRRAVPRAHRRRGAPDRRRGRRPLPRRASARCRRPACPTRSSSRSPHALRGLVAPLRAHARAVPRRRRRRRASACRCSAVLDELRDARGRRHRRARRDAARRPGRGVVRRRRAAAHPARHRWPAAGARSRPCPARRWRASCRAGSGVDDGGRGGPDRLRDVLVQLQGVPLPAAILEPAVLPRRVTGYRPELLDGLCAGRRGRLVRRRRRPRRPLLPRRRAAARPAGQRAGRPRGELADALRERVAQGGAFFGDLVRGRRAPRGRRRRDAVAAGLGRRGDQRRVRAVRAPRALARPCGRSRATGRRAAPPRRRRAAAGHRRPLAAAAPLFDGRDRGRPGAGPGRDRCSSATAS